MWLLLTIKSSHSLFTYIQQECIPVGCVPAARRPYTGVCIPARGVLPAWPRGVFSLSGPGGQFSLPGPGGFSLPGQGGFSLPGPGGFSLPGQGVLPAWRHPPVNRITHTCKNITLATTSLRPVITTNMNTPDVI